MSRVLSRCRFIGCKVDSNPTKVGESTICFVVASDNRLSFLHVSMINDELLIGLLLKLKSNLDLKLDGHKLKYR